MTRSISALVICGAAVVSLTAASLRDPDTRDAATPAEVARLRAHFDSVLGELRARDVAMLTASQRGARAELIRRLEGYSAAGRFPHNHVRPGEFVPVFRDEHETLCAMAFLIASTGRTDIVDAVAKSNNLAYLPELARNSATLRAWLDSTGLTVAEAARIQPQYGTDPCCVIVPDPGQSAEELRQARREYAYTTVGVTPFSAASVYLNLAAPRLAMAHPRATGWAGILLGGAQLAYGAAGMHYSDTRRGMAGANLAIGATALGSAVWRLRQPSRSESRSSSLNLAPVVGARSAGLLFSARM